MPVFAVVEEESAAGIFAVDNGVFSSAFGYQVDGFAGEVELFISDSVNDKSASLATSSTFISFPLNS